MLLNNHFKYEWFLIGIKLNGSIAVRKFRVPLYIFNHRRFPSTSTHCSLSEFPSRSSVLLFYPGIHNNESYFSNTHSPCLQRREPLSTDSPLVHSGLQLYPIQYEWGKVGSSTIYSGVWGIPIHPLTIGISPISVPFHLLGGFYLVLNSTCLDMNFDQLEMLITTRCDETGASDAWILKNTSPAGPGENVPSQHSTPWVVHIFRI